MWYLILTKEYPDGRSWMGREKCCKDIIGEKYCQVFVVNTWSTSWHHDLFTRTEEDGVCGCLAVLDNSLSNPYIEGMLEWAISFF